MPSTVLIDRPEQATPSTKHDSTGCPSIRTAHVPHSPSSQPCFVPVRPRSSRSTSSSVLCGANAISVCSPFTISEMGTFPAGLFGLFSKKELLSLLRQKVLGRSIQKVQPIMIDDRCLFFQPLLPTTPAYRVVDACSKVTAERRSR